MTDPRRDISLFISVARIEAALHSHRSALQRLPQEIAAIDTAIAGLDAREKAMHVELEELAKRRRGAEKLLREHEDHLKKTRSHELQVKTNDELNALKKEIANLEKAISAEEEDVLVLMDRMVTLQKESVSSGQTFASERARRGEEKKVLEARAAELAAEVERLTREKPKILSEISPALLKRYERLAERHSVAVTRVEAEHCGACHQQLPPQLAVEVRKNEQFLSCPACGRILVHYAD